jgi:hypothetical protein
VSSVLQATHGSSGLGISIGKSHVCVVRSRNCSVFVAGAPGVDGDHAAGQRKSTSSLDHTDTVDVIFCYPHLQQHACARCKCRDQVQIGLPLVVGNVIEAPLTLTGKGNLPYAICTVSYNRAEQQREFVKCLAWGKTRQRFVPNSGRITAYAQSVTASNAKPRTGPDSPTSSSDTSAGTLNRPLHERSFSPKSRELPGKGCTV